MSLTCALHVVSEDGSALIGPAHKVTLSGPAHSVPIARDAEINLAGAEGLGLAADWKTRPNVHGSVQILSGREGSTMTGLLIPRKDSAFDIFWANSKRLTASGAPITEVSGICSPVIESDDRKVMQ